MIAIGSGTRDIAVSRVVPSETTAGDVTMPVVGATVSANPAHNLKVFDLGSPCSRISVVCAAATSPETATHYRIFVD